MTRHRRLLAVVCIAVVVFAGVLPGAACLVCDVLVPLGPLFGVVVCALAPAAPDAALPPPPALSVLTSRAPPAA